MQNNKYIHVNSYSNHTGTQKYHVHINTLSTIKIKLCINKVGITLYGSLSHLETAILVNYIVSQLFCDHYIFLILLHGSISLEYFLEQNTS